MTTRPQLISRGGSLAFLLLHVAALAFLGVGANAFHLVRTHKHTLRLCPGLTLGREIKEGVY